MSMIESNIFKVVGGPNDPPHLHYNRDQTKIIDRNEKVTVFSFEVREVKRLCPTPARKNYIKELIRFWFWFILIISLWDKCDVTNC